MNLYKHIPAWSDFIIEKFINCMMQWGNKSVSRRILRDCFAELKIKWYKDAKETFKKALTNVTPSIEVKPKRVWWAIYQVPFPVNEKRQLFLSIRWILTAARKKKWMPMFKKLANEINDALNETWEAFKKKEEVRKMAYANKAFAYLARLWKK